MPVSGLPPHTTAPGGSTKGSKLEIDPLATCRIHKLDLTPSAYCACRSVWLEQWIDSNSTSEPLRWSFGRWLSMWLKDVRFRFRRKRYHIQQHRDGSNLGHGTRSAFPRSKLISFRSIASFLPYGENLSVGGVQISFHPAGHFLSSAQVRAYLANARFLSN